MKKLICFVLFIFLFISETNAVSMSEDSNYVHLINNYMDININKTSGIVSNITWSNDASYVTSYPNDNELGIYYGPINKWNALLNYTPMFTDSNSVTISTKYDVTDTLKIAFIVDNKDSMNVAYDLPFWVIMNDRGDIITNITSSEANLYDYSGYDVIVISDTVSATELAFLNNTRVGVLIIDGYAFDEFQMGAAQSPVSSQTQINISDNTHYITSDFSEETITIYSSAHTINSYTGTQNGVQKLATPTSTENAFISVIDDWNNLYDNSVAFGRRVYFGGLVGTDATNDYKILFNRSLEYASSKYFTIYRNITYSLDDSEMLYDANVLIYSDQNITRRTYYNIEKLLSYRLGETHNTEYLLKPTFSSKFDEYKQEEVTANSFNLNTLPYPIIGNQDTENPDKCFVSGITTNWNSYTFRHVNNGYPNVVYYDSYIWQDTETQKNNFTYLQTPYNYSYIYGVYNKSCLDSYIEMYQTNYKDIFTLKDGSIAKFNRTDDLTAEDVRLKAELGPLNFSTPSYVSYTDLADFVGVNFTIQLTHESWTNDSPDYYFDSYSKGSYTDLSNMISNFKNDGANVILFIDGSGVSNQSNFYLNNDERFLVTNPDLTYFEHATWGYKNIMDISTSFWNNYMIDTIKNITTILGADGIWYDNLYVEESYGNYNYSHGLGRNHDIIYASNTIGKNIKTTLDNYSTNPIMFTEGMSVFGYNIPNLVGGNLGVTSPYTIRNIDGNFTCDINIIVGEEGDYLRERTRYANLASFFGCGMTMYYPYNTYTSSSTALAFNSTYSKFNYVYDDIILAYIVISVNITNTTALGYHSYGDIWQNEFIGNTKTYALYNNNESDRTYDIDFSIRNTLGSIYVKSTGEYYYNTTSLTNRILESNTTEIYVYGDIFYKLNTTYSGVDFDRYKIDDVDAELTQYGYDILNVDSSNYDGKTWKIFASGNLTGRTMKYRPDGGDIITINDDNMTYDGTNTIITLNNVDVNAGDENTVGYCNFTRADATIPLNLECGAMGDNSYDSLTLYNSGTLEITGQVNVASSTAVKPGQTRVVRPGGGFHVGG